MKKLLTALLAATVLLSAVAFGAFGFEGNGFTITPCDPFTQYTTDEAGEQHMWQNPETGSNVLVKVGEQGTNIGTLSDEQGKVFKDTLIESYKSAFKEQLKTEPEITCRSMEKIDFKCHKALYIIIDMKLDFEGTVVEETQYVWVFTTKERSFFLYVTDNTGTEAEKGFEMINSFSTPDEPLGETEKVGLPSSYKTVVGVVAGAAVGAIVALFLVKKKKKQNGYVQSTFSTTPTPTFQNTNAAGNAQDFDSSAEQAPLTRPEEAAETASGESGEASQQSTDND